MRIDGHSTETIDTARRYWNAGLTVTAIARQMGVSPGVVSGISYRNDFSRRTPLGRWPARAVITPDGEYPSIHAAARAYGMSYGGACNRVYRRIYGWRYADE